MPCIGWVRVTGNMSLRRVNFNIFWEKRTNKNILNYRAIFVIQRRQRRSITTGCNISKNELFFFEDMDFFRKYRLINGKIWLKFSFLILMGIGKMILIFHGSPMCSSIEPSIFLFIFRILWSNPFWPRIIFKCIFSVTLIMIKIQSDRVIAWLREECVQQRCTRFPLLTVSYVIGKMLCYSVRHRRHSTP